VTRQSVIILLAIAAILPVAWYLGSPLFITNTVNEAFPFDFPSIEAQASMTDDEKNAKLDEVMTMIDDENALASLSDSQKAAAEESLMALSAGMGDKEMIEDMPASDAEWRAIVQGNFQGVDSVHQGSGSATVYQQGDKSILRLEQFSSTNGPALHVYLVENIAASRSSDFGEVLDLGPLKGNVGDQNYEIPDGTNLTLYKGVMIYCKPFQVVFSVAPF